MSEIIFVLLEDRAEDQGSTCTLADADLKLSV